MRTCDLKRVATSLLWLIGACAQSSVYGQSSGTDHRATTSGGGSGTVGGSISGTSTSGSSGTTGCTPYRATTLDDCPAGMVEIAGTAFDVANNANITAPVQIQVYEVPGLESGSLGCGTVYFCVDAGTPMSLEINVDGYAPTILGTIDAQHSAYYEQLPLLQASFVTLVKSQAGSLLPGGTINYAAGVRVSAVNANPACQDVSGWTIEALDDQDQPLADAGALYFDNFLPSSVDVTDAHGVVALYGAEQITTLRIKGFRGTDAGTACFHTPGEDQLTDSVPVVQNYFPIIPFVVDDPDGGWDAG